MSCVIVVEVEVMVGAVGLLAVNVVREVADVAFGGEDLLTLLVYVRRDFCCVAQSMRYSGLQQHEFAVLLSLIRNCAEGYQVLAGLWGWGRGGGCIKVN